ncbi:MAG: SDR family oxidoreductase [Bacteroidia bacterium]|nr:SDR family oxidoreductase [Bacteroidia bacterium]MBP9689651.1 SDR family oxidoreductase [Bacteroidia bacterium]
MNIDLTGKNAIVCGATKGIGNATATLLAQLGANVTMISRNESTLSRIVRDLDNSKGQVHDYIAADFNKPDDLREKIQQKVNEPKTFHILVNNTGGPPAGLAIEAELHEYTSAFTNHLLCNQVLAQAVVDGMRGSGYGRIINVISTSVKAPLKGLGVSNTIRAAVGNWAKTLSFELAPFGITVNNVLPGATGTDRLKQIIESKAAKQNHSIEEVSKEMTNEIPMARFATPQEIAYAIAFLASEYAAYITGINVPVDGGRTPNL